MYNLRTISYCEKSLEDMLDVSRISSWISDLKRLNNMLERKFSVSIEYFYCREVWDEDFGVKKLAEEFRRVAKESDNHVELVMNRSYMRNSGENLFDIVVNDEVMDIKISLVSINSYKLEHDSTSTIRNMMRRGIRY